MVYCIYCGTKSSHQTGAVFCSSCGKKTEADPIQASILATPPPPAPPPPSSGASYLWPDPLLENKPVSPPSMALAPLVDPYPYGFDPKIYGQQSPYGGYQSYQNAGQAYYQNFAGQYPPNGYGATYGQQPPYGQPQGYQPPGYNQSSYGQPQGYQQAPGYNQWQAGGYTQPYSTIIPIMPPMPPNSYMPPNFQVSMAIRQKTIKEARELASWAVGISIASTVFMSSFMSYSYYSAGRYVGSSIVGIILTVVAIALVDKNPRAGGIIMLIAAFFSLAISPVGWIAALLLFIGGVKTLTKKKDPFNF